MLKWDLDLGAQIGGGARTASPRRPTVGNGLVYATSWSGFVVAAKPKNGAIKWKYDTQSFFLGT